MTDPQWTSLLQVIEGHWRGPLPVGLLADGPWFSAFAKVPLIDYLTDDSLWLNANSEAVERFPDILWLPGFWAEFGMISNPPAFGGKCVWPEDGFPSCEPCLRDYEDIAGLACPDVETDGLLPLIIRRLKRYRSTIEGAGHRIRFATSHGPLTIAAYLLGHTKFFLGMREAPDAIRRLLTTVTRFIVDWLHYQKECFDSIEGILVLEDFMGFVGETDFQHYVLPFMTEIFTCLDVPVRFLHNDAEGLITARYLGRMNVNMFNFSFEHDANEIRQLAGPDITLVGNIPPRDILGAGTPEQVYQSAGQLVRSLEQPERFIVSAGGFTPAGLTAEKIKALRLAVTGADD